MARTASELKEERRARHSSEWLRGHERYLQNTQSFRKYGGIPGSGSGKVYDLKLGSSKSKDPGAKGVALARKINSPKAKEKRSLRHAKYEGILTDFGVRHLARLNRK